MANVATVVALPSSFSRGRGLLVDNQVLDVFVINHDSSTTISITSSRLKRIIDCCFVDWDGTVLTPTVTGKNTKTLTVTGLPANNKGITVFLKGSQL